MVTKIIPVILCGGSGTRLWPLSRSGFPKQFLSFPGDDGASLFQKAIERINLIEVSAGDSGLMVAPPLVVTNEEHRFLAVEQLRELNEMNSTLILEPVGRNTAPALTLAALCAQTDLRINNGFSDSESILVVVPADQIIQDIRAFTRALNKGIEVAKSGAIVILGITPTTPETGYGYIKRAEIEGANSEYDVEQFAEKPDAKTAKTYIDSGSYFWNSGMFVLKASTWLEAIKCFRPDIEETSTKAWMAKSSDQSHGATFIRPDTALFKRIPSESIDYAVIEKCPFDPRFSIKMVELDAGWNDLGAWEAVWQVAPKDEGGNVVSGDVILANTNNSLVRADSRLVGVVGVENLVVVETADAVLIANRSNSQDVKNIVSRLGLENREEKNLHRKVSRPWGWYDSVDEGERFKVKRICVNPGASLSLQMHHHRAEHWIVVRGVAEITNGDEVITLLENQSTYIPQGQVHRLSNPGTSPLEIIEVQSGSYLGEDDIVRFEDTYGRA